MAEPTPEHPTALAVTFQLPGVSVGMVIAVAQVPFGWTRVVARTPVAAPGPIGVILISTGMTVLYWPNPDTVMESPAETRLSLTPMPDGV